MAIRDWLGKVGARFTVGERIRGELQRKAQRRATGPGDFYTLQEVQILTEQYRQTYNRICPHNSLGYRPPAPEAILVGDPVPALVGLT